MKKRFIKNLKNDIKNIQVPDVLDNIVSNSSISIKETATKSNKNLKTSFLNSFMFKLTTGIAVFMLFFTSIFTVFNIRMQDSVYANTLISLDVNPSIELEVDDNEKLIKVHKLNLESKELLKPINISISNYINDYYDNFLESYIDLLIDYEYIDDNIENHEPETFVDNIILFSIINDNIRLRQSFEAQFSEKLHNVMTNKGIPFNPVLKSMENISTDLIEKNFPDRTVSKARISYQVNTLKELDEGFDLDTYENQSLKDAFIIQNRDSLNESILDDALDRIKQRNPDFNPKGGPFS